MDRIDLTGVKWIKSSRSNGQQACVEVAFLGVPVMPVRDSKDPTGPALLFSAEAWTAFIDDVKTGHYS